METNETLMTEHESLQVIQRMINSAKEDFSDKSFYYLLWGWLVFVASVGQFVLMSMDFAHPEMVWMLMPLGGVITAIYGRKEKRKEKVKTYFDEFNKHALVAFLVSLLIVLGSQQKLQINCYPMLIMVYGGWLYISGGALRFKPLMVGGVINWILAVACFFVDFKIQLLLLAAAVLLGYIIPGYMLKSRYQKQSITN